MHTFLTEMLPYDHRCFVISGGKHLDSASSDRPLLQQSSQPDHPRQVHTITDRFSMANTYLVNNSSLFVVDPGSEQNVRLLFGYLQRVLQRAPTDINLIVLTHLHPDHTAGVQALRQRCRAPVAASSVIRQLVQEKQANNKMLPALSHLAGRVLPGSLHHLDLFPPIYEEQIQLVDLWLDNVDGLPGHPDWRVIASPGHTAESLCLYNPFTWELLCGDTLITIEGGAPLLRAGTNRRQLEETLSILRTLSVHYLYPGHGRPILSLQPLNNVEVEW